MSHLPDFDIPAYLKRIGCDAVKARDLSALQDLHARHLERIPFENIDVFLGRPGTLELDALQRKLVHEARGGYCFEQNGLFAAALRALGFNAHTLEARVRPPGATAPLPRTHMLLRVDLDGRGFAADVGFGGDGPLLPVALDGTPCEQPHGVYRVDRERSALHVMRLLEDGIWRDLYAFTLTPAEAVDFEVAHHFTSTHPRSPFVQALTVQRCDKMARRILRGRCYTERRNGEETVREISDGEFGPLLEEELGLRLPEDILQELVKRVDAPELLDD